MKHRKRAPPARNSARKCWETRAGRAHFQQCKSQKRCFVTHCSRQRWEGVASPWNGNRNGTRSRSRSMPVPVPVPAVPGAVPTRWRPVAVLVWNGIGTDRSSHRYGRSSGRCCPFPFPFLAVSVPVSGRSVPVHRSWFGMVTDLDFFWTISAKAGNLATSRRPSLG